MINFKKAMIGTDLEREIKIATESAKKESKIDEVINDQSKEE